jgi:tRNA threonylcarbamoyladenosine biosynthesis protein TsaE
MTEVLEFQSRGPDDTRALAAALGGAIEAGDVLLLSGELGAGKTTFVQGLARGLGYEGSVSSKSFVLLGEYAGRVRLCHADLYRLEGADQVWELGLEEISKDGVLVVEWPERAAGLLPAAHLLVGFTITGEDSREISISAAGERPGKLLELVRAGMG